MAKNLKDTIVVITGGAGGIGFEIANQFLQKDAKVVILLDVEERQGTEAAGVLNSKYGLNKAVFYKCDVSKDLEETSKTIFDTYKYVDVLVNNAAILNEILIKKTINVNVTALMEWSLKYWEVMRKDKGGKGGTIINLASIWGYKAAPFLPIYQASKFAVMGFTKSLGHEYNFNRSGVRVVAICPGFTETNFVKDIKTWDDGFGEDFTAFLNNVTWQKMDSVGKAAVEIFENANSGTGWVCEGGQPIIAVP